MSLEIVQTTAEGWVPAPLEVEVGFPGPKGDAGESEGGIVVDLVANVDLSGQRVVTVNATGRAIYADSDNLSHADVFLAVTTGAALAEDTVSVRVVGVMTEPGWNWDTSLPIWLGSNGVLTQTVPTSGHSTQIATALSATSIKVAAQPSITL